MLLPTPGLIFLQTIWCLQRTSKQSKNVKGRHLKYKVNLREDRNKLKGKHLKPKVKETNRRDDK